LYSPAGDKFTSGDVLAIRSNRALIKEYEKELKRLKAKPEPKKNNIIEFPKRKRTNALRLLLTKD